MREGENLIGEGMSALIADDDIDCLHLLVSVVESLGVAVTYAHNGEEAWQLYQEQVPDLVVLDYTMPGLLGEEVAERIRNTEEGSYVAMLMVTARDDMSGRVAALEGGVDDYVSKPFHVQELRARVSALLRVRRLTRELKQKNEDIVSLQKKMLEQERKVTAQQLSGTAAHQLNQPLSALMLNMHSLQIEGISEALQQKIIEQMTSDLQRMSSIIERLQKADGSPTLTYHDDVQILDIDESSEDADT